MAGKEGGLAGDPGMAAGEIAKREGDEGNRFPYSPWPEMARGGLATLISGIFFWLLFHPYRVPTDGATVGEQTIIPPNRGGLQEA